MSRITLSISCGAPWNSSAPSASSTEVVRRSAEFGIFLLDDGGDGGGVEPAGQRQHQAEEQNTSRPSAAPGAEDADAHGGRQVEGEELDAQHVGEQGGAEAEGEDQGQQAQPAQEAQPADAVGDRRNPIAEVRRQSDGGHDTSSPQ